MELKDFKKGQMVYLRDLYCKDPDGSRLIEDAVVACAGKRYVTVKHWRTGEIKFDSHNDFRHCTNYSPSYDLHLTMDDAASANRRDSLVKEVYNSFQHYKVNRMSEEDLLTMKSILDKYERGL